MDEFVKYLVVAFSALLPLINPPGSALEFLGIVGVGSVKSYKVLARKIAVNTTLFLATVVLSGPYVLQFFGISVEILQCVGGAILVAMGWQLLNQPEGSGIPKTLTSSSQRKIASPHIGRPRLSTLLHSRSLSGPAQWPLR